jgi:hypothetical protein
MADKKISELTANPSALTGDEVFPLVQSAATYKGTIKDLAKYGYQSIVTDANATRTMALADRGAWVRHTNATSVALTVPLNATVAFGIGEIFNGIQAAAGQITIAGAGGVTINKPSGYNAKTRAQGSPYCLIKIATDVWDLIGDLELTA